MALTYTEAQVQALLDNVDSQHDPWLASVYQPVAETGIALTAGVENKVTVTTIPVSTVTPDGFGPYTTPQGPATRFVGSGLGNGESAIFHVEGVFSIEATTGAIHLELKGKTRPYTETDYANAVDIEGVTIQQDIPNNQELQVVLNGPFIVLSDGDLLEFSIIPDVNCTVNINSVALNISQVKEL